MIRKGIFSEARLNRLDAFAELEKALRQIHASEAEAKVELLQAISALPRSIRTVIEDQSVMDSLHQHGQWSRKLVWGRQSPHGFKTRREIEEQFRALVKAWKGVVKVSFDNDPDRVEVFLVVA